MTTEAAIQVQRGVCMGPALKYPDASAETWCARPDRLTTTR